MSPQKLYHNLSVTESVQSELFLMHIQGVSRLVDITAGGDFLGFCDQKSSYKHVSDLRSYDRLKLRGEGNDY
jgi:hypothetical protein